MHRQDRLTIDRPCAAGEEEKDDEEVSEDECGKSGTLLLLHLCRSRGNLGDENDGRENG